MNFAPGIERAFAAAPAEMAGVPLEVEGKLPPYLRGTWIANGPASFSRGGASYRHWLDGDGRVVAVRFLGDGTPPRATARYVGTAKRLEEEREGRAIYRAFGTAFPGDALVRGVALASPANVSVIPWQGRLIASGEQGLPYEVDPETLETRGEYTFGGKLNPISPLAAHPKLDPHTGELIHFGASFAGAQPSVTLYRFAADGALALRRRIPLDRPAVLHDFAVSDRFCLFHLSPYVVEVGPLLSEGKSLFECLAWREELGSRLVIVSREAGEEVATIALDGGHCLHLANAWDGENRLTVDYLELDRPAYEQYLPLPALFDTAPPGRLVRLEIDLAERAIVSRRTCSYEESPDFPAIDPRRFARPIDNVWMLGISATGQDGTKFFDRIVRLDWNPSEGPHDLWTAPPGIYPCSEPVIVPDPEKVKGGALLCLLYDAERNATDLGIFDAWNLAAGPQTRLQFPEAQHLCFHATFVPGE